MLACVARMGAGQVSVHFLRYIFVPLLSPLFTLLRSYTFDTFDTNGHHEHGHHPYHRDHPRDLPRD